jgi:predicted NUDIX family NTP pyrophosphohydrolase
MPTTSAGLLMYRIRQDRIEVLLVHPGGPFFKNKDEGAWSIPKGEVGADEDPLACAKREFQEELGQAPEGDPVPLRPIKQKGGKIVRAWAISGDCDTAIFRSNTFTMEWPPRSGRKQVFPEVDRAEFFPLELAKTKINAAQAALIDELAELLDKH